ncbi:MAG: S-adenosylmethionine decarboxylase [Casimicrobiaceae bacterium]
MVTGRSDAGGGLHLMAQWASCRGDPALMATVATIRDYCVGAARICGLTVVGERFTALAGGGVAGMVLLAESHLSIRTAPLTGDVVLDVFVCNHQEDNGHKARSVLAMLRGVYVPSHEQLVEVRRSGLGERALV